MLSRSHVDPGNSGSHFIPERHGGMTARQWLGLVLLGTATPVWCQEPASEYELKAASLYRFATDTHWPPDTLPKPGSPLSLCVFKGDDEFVQVMHRVIGEKKAGEHPLVIRHVRLTPELRSCHEIFFRGSMEDWRSALDELRNGGVLTIGEDDRFLAAGGMMNLSMVDGTLHVEVNDAALARSTVVYHARTPEPLASAEPVDQARPLQFSSLPSFPEMARRMNIRGAVQLEAVVRPNGTVKQVRVLGGHPLLAEIAARSVMQWRFKPEERETREVVKVNFRD